MLDLVCACHPNAPLPRPGNVHVPGAGRDMMLYALAKIARARKNGGRRYAGVVTYLAFHLGPGGAPVYPLLRAIQAVGFRPMTVTYARERGGDGTTEDALERYYVLCDEYNAAGHVVETWIDKLARHFPTPSTLCALDTGATRPQCV